MKKILLLFLLSNIFSEECHPDTGWCYSQAINFAFYVFDGAYINGVELEKGELETDGSINCPSYNCDAIGAFNGDVCVGWSTYYINDIDNKFTLTVNGSDGFEYSEGYLLNGQRPTFKIFDASSGSIFDAESNIEIPIYQNMGGLRMTEKISDRIFQLINSISLQEAVEKVKILEGKDSSSGIYTSSEELKAFQIIKTIIALTPRLKNKLDRVNYKDYKGQFKIIVDNMPSKEICHLIFNENSKKINFNGSISLLSKVSADEIAKHKKAIVDSAIKYLIGDE